MLWTLKKKVLYNFESASGVLWEKRKKQEKTEKWKGYVETKRSTQLFCFFLGNTTKQTTTTTTFATQRYTYTRYQKIACLCTGSQKSWRPPFLDKSDSSIIMSTVCLSVAHSIQTIFVLIWFAKEKVSKVHPAFFFSSSSWSYLLVKIIWNLKVSVVVTKNRNSNVINKRLSFEILCGHLVQAFLSKLDSR